MKPSTTFTTFNQPPDFGISLSRDGENAKIANGIAEVLPVRAAQIIDGAKMEVVDMAVPILDKVAPSITLYTVLGFALGIVISTILLVVVALMDDTIHDEDYVLNHYEYPVLAKIPDLLNTGNKRYGYYREKTKSERGE